VIAHQTDDVEPSITITGMCLAVERDSSGYINGFPSRGLKYTSGNILTPKMCSELGLSNPSRWFNFGNRLIVLKTVSKPFDPLAKLNGTKKVKTVYKSL
jgi:hypothetical protein